MVGHSLMQVGVVVFTQTGTPLLSVQVRPAEHLTVAQVGFTSLMHWGTKGHTTVGVPESAQSQAPVAPIVVCVAESVTVAVPVQLQVTCVLV